MITPDVIVTLLTWQKHASVRLPILTELPEGYQVGEVFYDNSRAAFMVKIHHPSFPEVNIKAGPLIIGSNVVLRTIELPTEDGD